MKHSNLHGSSAPLTLQRQLCSECEREGERERLSLLGRGREGGSHFVGVIKGPAGGSSACFPLSAFGEPLLSLIVCWIRIGRF